MSTTWKILTHGDPLAAVRNFIHGVWIHSNLDGMLAPVNGSEKKPVGSQVIDKPELLAKINPFKPLMTTNTARMVPELIRTQPQSQLAALLRPCEMRALIEMPKHDGFTLDKFVTICVDCLGTYPADEYQWRAARRESHKEAEDDNLHFARQGGIMAYRYRSACQTCASPQASGADYNLMVIGLPVRQAILVAAKDENPDIHTWLDAYTAGPAEPELIEQHEKILAKILERHQRTSEKIVQGLGEHMPGEIQGVITQLESCGDCQNCMAVCPICSMDYPQRDKQGGYQQKDVVRWLISCAGCGMCEQACTRNIPTSTIFRYIQSKLAEEYGYLAGLSSQDPLPEF